MRRVPSKCAVAFSSGWQNWAMHGITPSPMTLGQPSERLLLAIGVISRLNNDVFFRLAEELNLNRGT